MVDPWFRDLAGSPGSFRVNFQQCMKGGTSDKWSTWLTNVEELMSMEAKCNKQHEHAPWEVVDAGSHWNFSTSEEADYPEQMQGGSSRSDKII